MDQYLLIPFLGGWTSIYQLFWCSPGVQGFDTLPHHETSWSIPKSTWAMLSPRTTPLRIPSLGRFSRTLLLGGAVAASLASLETSVRCAPATSQDMTPKGRWCCLIRSWSVMMYQKDLTFMTINVSNLIVSYVFGCRSRNRLPPSNSKQIIYTYHRPIETENIAP